MNNSLVLKSSTDLNLAQLNESKSMFSFLASKISITSVCLYKSQFILLLSDYTILIYDAVTESTKFEITDAKPYSPIQIDILYYQHSRIQKDHILLLSETKIAVLNFSDFQISYELALNYPSTHMKIHFSNDLYQIIITQKTKISIYNVVKSSQTKCEFVFYLYYKIDCDEPIISRDLMVRGNLIGFESRNNIYFFLYDFINGNKNDSRAFSKKENFSSELYNINEIDSLERALANSPIKDKNIDYFKVFQISYSALTNTLFMCVLNKIFLVKDIYDESENKFLISKDMTQLSLIDKIIKPNIILYSAVVGTFFLFFSGDRIYIYFIADLNRCIENIEINCNFTFAFEKNLSLFRNLNLLNIEYDCVEYNDIILNRDMKKKYISGDTTDTQFLLNSSQFSLFFLYNNYKKIQWITFNGINTQLKKIKMINTNFASKFLRSYKSKKQNNSSVISLNTQLTKENDFFILLKSLELIYELIGKDDFGNASICVDEIQIDFVFILVLIRKSVKSKLIIFLMEYYLKMCVCKFLTSFENESEKDYQTKVNLILNLITKVNINKDDEIPMFLKHFFSKISDIRVDLHNLIAPEKMKKISIDNFLEDQNEFKDLSIASTSNLNAINSLEFFNKINESFSDKGINELEIKLCIYENILFFLNYTAYKISKDDQYGLNMKNMIKQSFNILDKSVIDMLSEIKLEEEILLFYYHKGNFQKCINLIVSIYDKISDENENDSDEEKGSYNSLTETTEEISNFIHQKNSNKAHWLKTYVSLICKISKKISESEYKEYIKWALEKDPLKTIDILISNNKISSTTINENFVEILKKYGIDPVIYYLKKFVHLEGNEQQINEMINLYAIKLKLLLEINDNSSKAKIAQTREELCLFLVTNNNYNISYAFDKISEISICQTEIGIILIKQNNYEEGINKLFFDEAPIKIILLILEFIPEFDLVYMILKKLLTTKIKFSDDIENMIILILNKIQHKSDILVRLLQTDIFDELECEKLTEFFVRILNNLEGARNRNKIITNLVKNESVAMLSKLYDFESREFVMTKDTRCSYCKRLFSNEDTIAVIQEDEEKVYHESCYDFLQENGNENN